MKRTFSPHVCGFLQQKTVTALCCKSSSASAYRWLHLDHRCQPAVVSPDSIQLLFTRNIGFFNKISGADLWGSVTGVSAAGRKKGRGKRVGRKKNMDLNKGQQLGTGKSNMLWPGLNAPVFKGSQVIERKQLPPNPDYQNDLVKIREQMGKIQITSISPMLRGYSGKKRAGQTLGQPESIGDYKFDGFDSRVLEYKIVSNMTGTLGRKHQFSAFVAVGNGNGIAGYGRGKAQNGKTALNLATNRAAQHLMYIPRYEDHTVYHNMFTQLHRTKVFIHKKEKGYGLVCHRVLKTLCLLAGIKDIHCKVEGSTKNIQALTKAFFNGLTNQETHQELADRLKLHVVEIRSDKDDLPVCVASPQSGEVRDKPYVNEDEDLEGSFTRIYFGGKIEYEDKYHKSPPWHTLKSWKMKCDKEHRKRNQRQAQIMRRAGQW